MTINFYEKLRLGKLIFKGVKNEKKKVLDRFKSKMIWMFVLVIDINISSLSSSLSIDCCVLCVFIISLNKQQLNFMARGLEHFIFD